MVIMTRHTVGTKFYHHLKLPEIDKDLASFFLHEIDIPFVQMVFLKYPLSIIDVLT